MDYLTLCKRTSDIIGFQGVITSVSATGYQKVLTQAVKDSWEDIQRYRKDWDYMRATRTINVVSGQEYYSLSDLWGTTTPDLAQWLHINYDYKRLQEFTYDAYELMDFTEWEADEPRLYSIDPATKGLYINPVGASYPLDIYYIRSLQMLTVNTDEPWLPERFQQAIIYGACMKLADFVGKMSLYDTYSVKYAEIMGQLMREENPPRFVRKRPIA